MTKPNKIREKEKRMSKTTEKTPFDAIDQADLEKFKEVLATKVDINAKNDSDQNDTPLISIIDALVTANNEETDVYYKMIDLLLKDTRLDINIQNKKGYNALGLAASLKLYSTVEKLLEHGSINSSTLERAEEFAKEHNAQDIAKKIEKQKETIRDLEVVKKLLNKITITSKYVNALLCIPVIGDIIKAVRYNIDSRYANGNTALILASIHGSIKDVNTLVEFGADVNIRNQYGDTALI